MRRWGPLAVGCCRAVWPGDASTRPQIDFLLEVFINFGGGTQISLPCVGDACVPDAELCAGTVADVVHLPRKREVRLLGARVQAGKGADDMLLPVADDLRLPGVAHSQAAVVRYELDTGDVHKEDYAGQSDTVLRHLGGFHAIERQSGDACMRESV